MNEGSIQFVTVCKAEDIPPGERIFIEINRVPIVVFNIQGEYYAMKDVCSHDNGPVGEGDLEGYEISCPRHGARFDVRNGKVLSPPAFEDNLIFPMKNENGELKIGLENF